MVLHVFQGVHLVYLHSICKCKHFTGIRQGDSEGGVVIAEVAQVFRGAIDHDGVDIVPICMGRARFQRSVE